MPFSGGASLAGDQRIGGPAPVSGIPLRTFHGYQNRVDEKGQIPNGSPMAEYRLRHDPTAAAIARSKITDELTLVLDPLRLDDSGLMVTELVSNAVRHAPPESDGKIVLEVEREPGVARVIVRDGGSHLDLNEIAFNPGPDGHYGLFVVDTLADQWGFSIDGDKGVWFEMRTD